MCTVDTLSSLLELPTLIKLGSNRISRIRENERAKPFPSYTGIWSLRLPSYKRAQGLFHRTRAFGLFCSLPGFHRTRAFGLFCRHRRTKCCFLPAPPADTVRTKCCFLPAPPAHPPPSILYGQAARKASSRSIATLHLYGQAAQ